MLVEAARHFRLLRPALGLRNVFMELRAARRPGNLVPLVCDGIAVPVPAGTIDVAFGCLAAAHAQPREALEHLRNVHRALVPGGRYFCIPQASGTAALRGLLLEAGFRKLRFYAGVRGWTVRMPALALPFLEAACIEAVK